MAPYLSLPLSKHERITSAKLTAKKILKISSMNIGVDTSALMLYR